MNKKVLSTVLFIVCFCGITLFAQTNQTNQTPKQLYPSSLAINSIGGPEIILANIDVYGRVTIAPKSSVDEVINTLVARMISQNNQYQQRVDQLSKIVENQQLEHQFVIRQLDQILQVINPPAVPLKESKKESPKVENKKGFWARLFGNK